MKEKNKDIIFVPLSTSKQFKLAVRNITTNGLLKCDDKYVYLKVDDKFILELFPLLKYDCISLPPYFSQPYNIGAHITVIYKEEMQPESIKKNINNLFNFEVGCLHIATADRKKFLVLKVKCPTLERFRLTNNLPKYPIYHGYSVQFHITIAVNANISL